MQAWPITLVGLLIGADALGPAVRQEFFSIRPPNGFFSARGDLFRASRVAAIARNEQSHRRLLMALMDSDSEDATVILLASVDEPLKLGAGVRDELSTAVARHFASELGLKFSLQRAEVVLGVSPRVEVKGNLREGSQLRQLVVAAWPGESRHAVAVFSIPAGRYEAMAPLITASLDSFRSDPPVVSRARTVTLALLALGAAALAASVGLWIRRRADRQLAQQPPN